MRKLFIAIIVLICLGTMAAAQSESEPNIKLFVHKPTVISNNTSLTPEQGERLYRKTLQLITQTGVADFGFSTFMVLPKFDIISVSSNQTGTAAVYLAECELEIQVDRVDYGKSGGASFNVFSKSITGSGLSRQEAINNAINTISGNDKKIIAFLTDSKNKIDAYFKQHCNEVVAQAKEALALKNYDQAIALYFSVPASAPCYQDALNGAQKVYNTIAEDDCNKMLVKLKAFISMGINQNTSNKNYYDSALAIMGSLNPASVRCYNEALQQVKKIEARFTEEQKQNWELTKQAMSNDAEIKKEQYKAISKISAAYQPPATVIIVH